LAAAVLYALAAHRRGLLVVARVVVAAATLLLAGLLVLRSVQIGFPALTGTYEGLLTSVFILAALAALGQKRILRENTTVLAASTFVAFALLAVLSSPIVSSDLHPPLPILRSGWLVLHVAFAFVGLSLFTVALIAAIVGIVTSGGEPSGSTDSVRDRSIVGGFVFYATGGLVFGAIWAEAAWGRFWGWDPKETWALVTTLAYAIYLHLRYARRSSPTVLRIGALVAWLVGVFTFFGVNYLMSGLHSYG
jgi:ABC-type transport system involved in cytochrome c biogenesis permease subunit